MPSLKLLHPSPIAHLQSEFRPFGLRPVAPKRPTDYGQNSRGFADGSDQLIADIKVLVMLLSVRATRRCPSLKVNTPAPVSGALEDW